MSNLCIYHGNCADGFTSAWVVRKALGDIEFHAGVYQTAPPDVKGKDVYLVDFSYKRDVLEALRDSAKSVTVLDHHKSAMADLEGLEGVKQVFDMERSDSLETLLTNDIGRSLGDANVKTSIGYIKIDSNEYEGIDSNHAH